MKIFSMNESEFINDMITKFTKITNALAYLNDEIDNDQRRGGQKCSSTILGGQI